MLPLLSLLLFFFNDPATTEIYTLSLHDALPISAHPSRRSAADRSFEAHAPSASARRRVRPPRATGSGPGRAAAEPDRKSTRLNSSHTVISYAVFCLKKKKKKKTKILLLT